MLKIVVCFFSLIVSIPSYALLGPHMLVNSPSEYLLDLDSTLNDPATTKQIGDELYKRNYIASITTYDSTIAGYNARPTSAGSGYTSLEGCWIWIPDSLNSDTGTWYWILKIKPYYLSLLDSLTEDF